ncbi:MAG: sigma-70 family RNA polymerase sigma factor [Planctomycetes bacterium]|jgi:RNA polymerase sigma-70 factor (ECF subfamily)|nr:sigma-70 family RNA polymerase sigma factor [Planctomycetota bacterium]
MRIESLEQSDADLVEAAQQGRLDSFGVLYQRYHNPMVALAYAQLGDKHTAEDAAQEVFAVACRDLRSLREREKFGPWLGGICRNVCRQMLRVKTRATPLPGRPATPGREPDAVPEDGPEQQEQWEAVRRAVWQLPTDERELIVMRYFNGFSQARISEVLDLTPAAVNGRLTRAKRKIAEWLEHSGFGSESWDA